MESIVHSALEEICAQGANGLTLPNLFPKLQSSFSSHGLHPCVNVKKALWTNLLNIPGLHLESRGVACDPHDSSIQSVEDCEKLNLKIVAAEHLRNSYVGIYDIKASDAGISLPQRRALERLAIARTNGITQSELAKEFGIKGNNIFYILRNLECRGLIVRQSTILRKKEAFGDGESKNNSIVTTNMLHLYRYAKHLGCQQRLEVIKEDKSQAVNGNEESAASGCGIVEECVKDDVHVKDYLPALKTICNKLEEAEGKVLIVSDIKRDLGYRGTSGHRAWRNICHRLKGARVVKEFQAKVNTKEVNCLRLLKKFSPKHFEPKSLRCGTVDFGNEDPVKLGNRCQISDQIVELPIEHQIYDMIDAEGSKGLTITELCKRLGLNNKRYYTRLLNMFTRFGMHLDAESHNRGVGYRVWTSRNFNSEGSNVLLVKPDDSFSDKNINHVEKNFEDNRTDTVHWDDHCTSEVDAIATAEISNIAGELEVSQGLPTVDECGDMLLCPSSSPKLASELSTVQDAELQIVSKTPLSGVVSLDSPGSLSTHRKRRSYQKYPCLTLNALSTQREHRIREILQDEKFMIKAELHRKLESLEKDKHTMMDRKTLERSLNNLQKEGFCKCISVSVPVVTSCGRSRTTDVVLRPPNDNVSPELLGQIYERVRSFDIQIRIQVSSKLKKSQEVPVLDGVQRIQKKLKLDDQSVKLEALRANGFVLAKMVRTKLLHIFLWDYVKSLPGWNEALISGKHGYDQQNPHSTCKMFEVETAIKAMPLELFLQIAGSDKKFEDLIEKCRNGLCLSDLPVQEYKYLMTTRATSRLSNLIDILRRLKLIRMVSQGCSEDAAEASLTTLVHSLELKPYIEEPVSMLTSSSPHVSLDIRPHVRHDFILSSRKAVDEYWNTLEYCYAAVNSEAALHAFPGSAVHEVFLFRSWTSVRVMTSDQRAKLLNRITNDDPNKKLSFRECEKITNELDLTLEQVLRVYYDRRQRRLTRLQGILNPKEEIQRLNSDHASSSRKRKTSLKRRPSKHVKLDSVAEESAEPKICSDTDDQLVEEHSCLLTPLREQELYLLKDQVDENMDAAEELELHEAEEGDHSFIPKSRLKPTRRRKFIWTEDADRQLVIEYARHCAALGAKFHRTDWSTLPNLPASPDACRRRMALLKSGVQFRKALMRLCNILTERYSKHLYKFQNKSICNEQRGVMVRTDFSTENCSGNVSDGLEQCQDLDCDDRWDDLNNKDTEMSLEEVLRHKRVAKLDKCRGVHSVSKESSNVHLDGEQHDPNLISSTIPSMEIQKCRVRSNVSDRRSSYHRLHKKYIKLFNKGLDVSRQVYKSLAVSNAVELFKLVFLSTSTAPETPSLLAETLRRYSEHDLFAAFNYLREAKIMVGGSGTSPFVLSQPFIQRISSSPYPINTGKRASKFASWLHEKERNLMEEGIDLPANMQCGDVIYLSAILYSRELLISPCLPDQGVGEAEDSRTSKRKRDDNEFDSNDSAKRHKSLLTGEGEIISRREKGFPGIRLSLGRASISRVDVVDLFKEMDIHCNNVAVGGSKQNLSPYTGSSSPVHMKSALNFEATIPLTVYGSDSLWEVMTCYGKNLVRLASNEEQGSSLCPEVLKNVCSAIQQAGDQGLHMEEISSIMNMEGDMMPEVIVEVLEAFGRALKVNSYDSVHIVDSLYRSKYCLTSLSGLCHDHTGDPNTNSKGIINEEQLIVHLDSHKDDEAHVLNDPSMDAVDGHRVTILNLPEDQPIGEIQNVNETDSCQQTSIFPGRHQESDTCEFHHGKSNLCRPILPWINGDGTVNEVVYRGLIRRVLGILMQNPGMVEVDILRQMNVLNPQSCRKLLELMIMDNNIIVRKMHQATSCEPPAILGGLIGSSSRKSKLIFREHFFANPMSCTLL